jgi:hypothetical protein
MQTKLAGELAVGEVVCEGDGVMYEVMAVASTNATVTLTIRPMFRAFFSSMRGMPETLEKRFRKSTRVYFGGLASEKGEAAA